MSGTNYTSAAVRARDPRVLPWCVSKGVVIEPAEVFRLSVLCAAHDRLENLIYLMNHVRLREVPEAALRVAFEKYSERTLRHFVSPGDALTHSPLHGVYVWSRFWNCAPSPEEALRLLADLGLVQPFALRLQALPDLRYLKLRAQLLDWDTRLDDQCLVQLVEDIEWTPQTECCALWLIERGAPITAEFFSQVSGLPGEFHQQAPGFGLPEVCSLICEPG